MATEQKSKMLIVMALAPESGGLIEKTLAEHNIEAHLIYTGVGLISAAQKTTEAILHHKPHRILNLGTAGSRKFSQGTLVECHEFIYRGDISYIIKNKHTVETFTDLQKAVCASADHVDLGPIKVECDVMDMEAFALAKVCENYQIPFHSIKYVTDASDANMLQDWKENLKHGAIALSDFLKKVSF
jgi:adenosylhomocysteine nucleosidase